MDRRPPGPSAAGRWLAASVAAAVLVFGVIAACSDDDDDPKGPTATVGTAPSTTEPAPTTTTIEDVEAEVEAAYREAEAAYYEAGVDPSIDLAVLEKTRVGRSLRDVLQGLSMFRDDGLVVEYGNGFPVARIDDIEVEGERAVVRSCVVDDGVVRRASDGTVFNDRVVAREYSVRLVVDGGHWKVEREEVLRETEGERCPA